jgi:site-specific recombinase XerD
MITDGEADILAVSRLPDHTSVRQTQRYSHLTPGHITAQVDKVLFSWQRCLTEPYIMTGG